jgi:hypothetical protein
VFANDFLDERTCFVVWSSSGGNDTCAYGQVEINGLAGRECHYLVADLNIDCGARVVAKAEFDHLCLGEHRMNRGGDGGRSSIDCWDRKKRSSDYCDGGKAIVAFHCKLPIASRLRRELSAMVQEARRGLSYANCVAMVPIKK